MVVNYRPFVISIATAYPDHVLPLHSAKIQIDGGIRFLPQNQAANVHLIT